MSIQGITMSHGNFFERTCEMDATRTESRRSETRTVPLVDAGRALGVGRTSSYESARAGTFPLPVIRVGKRIVVSKTLLERLLGETAG